MTRPVSSKPAVSWPWINTVAQVNGVLPGNHRMPFPELPCRPPRRLRKRSHEPRQCQFKHSVPVPVNPGLACARSLASLPWSRICCAATIGSRRDMDLLRFVRTFSAEVRPGRPCGAHFRFAVKHRCQLAAHLGERKTGRVPKLELHRNIHVAFGPGIVSYDRAIRRTRLRRRYSAISSPGMPIPAGIILTRRCCRP